MSSPRTLEPVPDPGRPRGSSGWRRRPAPAPTASTLGPIPAPSACSPSSWRCTSPCACAPLWPTPTCCRPGCSRRSAWSSSTASARSLAADQAVWVAVGVAAFIGVLFALPDHRGVERYRYLIGLDRRPAADHHDLRHPHQRRPALDRDRRRPGRSCFGEARKVLIVIFLAAYSSDKRGFAGGADPPRLGRPRRPCPRSAWFSSSSPRVSGFVVVLNDFGTALLFLGVFLKMIYLASGRAAYTVFGLAVFLVIGGGLLWSCRASRAGAELTDSRSTTCRTRGSSLVQLARRASRGRGTARARARLPGARRRLDGGAGPADRLHVHRGRHRRLHRRGRHPARLPGADPARLRDRGQRQRRLLEAPGWRGSRRRSGCRPSSSSGLSAASCSTGVTSPS